jgi:hypothetical protein
MNGKLQRYEYRTRVYDSNLPDDEAQQYVESLYPDHTMRKFDFMKVEAFLNTWGEKGWELVHMELVNAIGENGDLGVRSIESANSWRRVFFCVFRRPAD